MLYTKSQCYRPLGSEEGGLEGFTIYGSGNHLGHVNKFSSQNPTEAQYEIWLQSALG